MRIERIDDKTVKCYLSSEELEEYDITYKDFLLRSQKAKDMVEQIIAQAIEEVNYKPPEFAMDMQIMMLPDKGMLLTLSERTPEEIQNNPMLKEYLAMMKQMVEQKLQQGGLSPEAQKGEGKTEKKMPDCAIFAFSSLRAVCEYAKILPKMLRINSALYVDKGMYYLWMEKGTAAYKRYSSACILAMEYGTLYGADEHKLAYLQEHGECLIGDKAIQKLRL